LTHSNTEATEKNFSVALEINNKANASNQISPQITDGRASLAPTQYLVTRFLIHITRNFVGAALARPPIILLNPSLANRPSFEI